MWAIHLKNPHLCTHLQLTPVARQHLSDTFSERKSAQKKKRKEKNGKY